MPARAGEASNLVPVIPVYYRTDDPVQNLRVRVTVYKVDTIAVAGKGKSKASAAGTGGAAASAPSGDGDGDGGAAETKARGDDSGSGSDGEGGGRSRRSRRGRSRDRGDDAVDVDGGRDGGRDVTEEVWSSEFAWQEKQFGPSEILKYVKLVEERKRDADRTMAKTRLVEDYVNTFADRLKGKDDVFKTEPVALFTYTDKDGFVPREEVDRRVLTADAEHSSLAETAVRLGTTLDLDSGKAGDTSFAHLYRDAPFRTMYVMAAVDIDTSEFKLHNPRTRLYEKPLLAIKAYNHSNLLEMRPGFSPPGKAKGSAAAAAASAAAARRRGAPPPPTPRKRYRFTSPHGGVYEYTIENAASGDDDASPGGGRRGGRADDEALLEAERARERRAMELQAGKITTSFFGEPPRHESFRLYAFLELVAAANFDAESLFVEYEVRLPRTGGWKLPKLPTYGQAAGGGTTGSGAGPPTSLLQDKAAVAAGCAGVSQTARVAWRQWRWRSNDRVGEENSAGLGGGLGVGAGAGAGAPGRHTHATVKSSSLVGTSEVYAGDAGSRDAPWLMRSRPASRGSMLGGSGSGAEAYEGLEKPGAAPSTELRAPVAHLCVPIEFQLLSHIESAASPHLGHQWPSVYFTVRTRDSWGRERVLGYGRYELPATPSTVNATVSTWRPVGNVRQQMGDFFLGGATALDDVGYVGLPHELKASTLSKYGFETESAGDLALRVNTVVQRHVPGGTRPRRGGGGGGGRVSDARLQATMERFAGTGASALGGTATSLQDASRRLGGRPPLASSFEVGEGGARRRRRDRDRDRGADRDADLVDAVDRTMVV